MNAIAKIRNKVNVPRADTVEIVIGSRDPTYGNINDNVRARFVCVSCDNIFEWFDGMFQCLGCGVDLLPSEAADICDLHREQLEILSQIAGRKLGFFKRLWRRIRRGF